MTQTTPRASMKIHRRNTSTLLDKLTIRFGLALLILSALVGSTHAQETPDLECQGQVDLVFLIDASWSISPETFGEIRHFVIRLYEDFWRSLGDSDLKVGVILYANNVYGEKLHLAADPPGDLPHFMANFNRSRSNVRTNTAAGLSAAMTMFEEEGRPGATKLLLLITDGVSNSRTDTMEEAEQLSRTNIHAFCIGIGQADRSELRAIASSNNAVFYLTSFDLNMDAFRTNVAHEMCSETHYQFDPDRFPPVPVDIYFLLDELASSNDYSIMKNFIKAIIGRFVMGSNAAQFGITGYSDMAYPYIYPDTYVLEAPLFQDLDSLQRPALIPNGHDVNAALTWLLDHTESTRDPDRLQVAVLFTSGQSTTDIAVNARRLAAKGVAVFVVAVGRPSQVWMREVFQIATDPRLVMHTNRFSNLIPNEGNQERVDFVALALYSVASGSFAVTGQQERWREAFDVIFVIDGSTSYASSIEFSLTKHVIAKMISTFTLGVDSGRVGVIVYDSITAYETITLGDYTDREHLLDKIDDLVNIERTERADNIIGMEAAIKQFAASPRDVFKACYIFTASSSSDLPLAQVIHRKAHVSHGIFMRPVFISRANSPPVPAAGELFQGQVHKIVDQESDHTLGSSVVQAELDTMIHDDVENGQSVPYGPWSYGFDMLVLIHNVVNPDEARLFLSDLASKFNLSDNDASASMSVAWLGVIAYGEDGKGRLRSVTKIKLNEANNMDAKIQDMDVSSKDGSNKDTGVMDLLSVYEQHGRPTAPRLAVLVMQDDSTVHPDLQTSVEKAAAAGVRFVTVGVGLGAQLESLQSLAHHPQLTFPQDVLSFTPHVQAAVVALATNTFVPQGPLTFLRTERVCSVTSGIVFILDASAQSQPSMDTVKAFVLALMDGFDLTSVEIGTVGYTDNGVFEDGQIGLGRFTMFGDLYVEFNTYMRTDPGASPSATGAVHEGVVEMVHMFRDRPYSKKHAVLFTDGVPENYELTEQAIRDAETMGIDVVVVSTRGMLPGPESLRLQQLSEHQTFMFSQADLADPDKLAVVHSVLCDTSKCPKPMDLVLVIDCSISIDPSDFNLLKLSLWKLIERFQVGPDLTRIGVVCIGDGISDFILPLSQSLGELEVKLPIMRLQNDETKTNTGGALERVTEMFATEGRNPGVFPWVALVLSDGKSTDIQKTRVESIRAHLHNIHVEVVALGTSPELGELQAMASDPSALKVFADYQELYRSETFADNICQVAQNYEPPDSSLPEVFTCEHAMDIVAIRDVGAPRHIANFQQFVNKLQNNFDSSRLMVLVSSPVTSLEVYIRLGTSRMQRQTPRLSTRLMVLTTDRVLSPQEKVELMVAADEAKNQGIVIVVVDVASPSNNLQAMASIPTLYFQEQNFHTSQGLVISCCIENCEPGFERLVSDDLIGCEPCEIGQYRDPLRSYVCEPCSSGLTTQQTGADSVRDCVQSSTDTGSIGGPTDPLGPLVPGDVDTDIIQDLQLSDRQCVNAIDLVFVIDGSPSIGRQMNFLKIFLKRIMRRFDFSSDVNPSAPSYDRMAIVEFASDAVTHLDLSGSTSASAVETGIDKLGALNFASIASNTHKGINMAVELMRTQGRTSTADVKVVQTIAVVTDGYSSNPSATSLAAQQAAAAYSRIFAIGVGELDNLAKEELESISDGESLMLVPQYLNFVNDQTISDQFLQSICEDTFSCTSTAIDVYVDGTPTSASDSTFQDQVNIFLTAMNEIYPGLSITRTDYTTNNDLASIPAPTDAQYSHVLLIITQTNINQLNVKTHLEELRSNGGYVIGVINANSLSPDDFEEIVSDESMLFTTETFQEPAVVRYVSRKFCIERCPDGEERSEDGTCGLCEAGTYRVMGDSVMCEDCPPGETSAPGATECEPGTDDDCIGVICQNGGQCIDGENTFTCDCVDPWFGTFCEHGCGETDYTSLADGATSQILYPPSSVSYPDDASCTWQISYGSPRSIVLEFLSLEVQESSSNFCSSEDYVSISWAYVNQNGDEVTSYRRFCQSADQYEPLITPSTTSMVTVEFVSDSDTTGEGFILQFSEYGGGTCGDCVNGVCELSPFVCICDLGWTGQFCDEAVVSNPCRPNPCQNGGICTDNGGIFECDCPPGLTGETCNTAEGGGGGEVNECNPDPCQNGATCYWGEPAICFCASTPTSSYTGVACDSLVTCAPGENWNVLTQQCEPCPWGYYSSQTDEECTRCPDGQTTGMEGSSSAADCTPDTCEAGQQLITGTCELCPEDTYKGDDDDFCIHCLRGQDTDGKTGRKKESHCKGIHCREDTDLVIVVDMSSGNTDDDVEEIKTCLRRLMDSFHFSGGTTEVTIIRYAGAGTAERIVKRRSRKGLVMDAIDDDLERFENSAEVLTAPALELAREDFLANRKKARRALLHLSNHHSDDLIAATALARALEMELRTTIRDEKTFNNCFEITAVGPDTETVLNLASNWESAFASEIADAFDNKAAIAVNLCYTEWNDCEVGRVE